MHLTYYNIEENDTLNLPLQLHGGINTTETTDPTEQPAMDTEAIATHNDAPDTERKPPKRRASEAGVGVPESADVDTVIKQHQKDVERTTRQNHEEVMSLTTKNVKQNHEAVMTSAKQNNDKIITSLSTTLSSMKQENNARFARVEGRIDEHEHTRSNTDKNRRN